MASFCTVAGPIAVIMKYCFVLLSCVSRKVVQSDSCIPSTSLFGFSVSTMAKRRKAMKAAEAPKKAMKAMKAMKAKKA